MAYDKDEFIAYIQQGKPLTVNGKSGLYGGNTGLNKEIVTLNKSDCSFKVSEIKTAPEVDAEKARIGDILLELEGLGAALIPEAQWPTLTPESGFLLICLRKAHSYGYSKDFYVNAYVTASDGFLKMADKLSPNEHYKLRRNHDIYGLWNMRDTGQLPINTVAKIYRLNPIWEVTEKKARSAPVQSLSAPYLITTEANGHLPDMTDFSLQRVGSLQGGWNSSCMIKAGRSLNQGEKLTAFMIDRVDGDIRKIDYTAQKDKLTSEKWPQAFADHLAAQDKSLAVGDWDDVHSFSRKGQTLRLWTPARYRVFTTAPFAGNLVQALACDESFAPLAGAALCLQVRDLTSQALYEQHFFTPTDAQLGESWSKALAEQINRDSRLLRAGALDGCTVTPATRGNAFWAPQSAELAVTLTETRWWQSQTLDAKYAHGDGQTLQAWAYDAFSHRLVASHQWTPSEAQRAAGKCLRAWAAELNASQMSPYLRVASHNPDAGQADESDNLSLWQRGDALRIYTSLTDTGNYVPGPSLGSAWQDDPEHAVLVTLRHPFSRKLVHRALFRPQDYSNVKDLSTWLQALADLLKQQGWPELQVAKAGDPIGIARFSELQLSLENVGDGELWSEDDYATYLLDTDELPGKAPADEARFSVQAGEASTQITVESLNGELEFKLAKAAFDKGYRVVACVPRPSEQPQWPVEVSDRTIVWSGPIKQEVYDLYLTYPEHARDGNKLTVGHIGALHPTQFWHGVQAVSFTPPAAMRAYEEINYLCEDYGNTVRSEVFDAGNKERTGVDERTGLFHVHYPIATLQGMLGLGPICDLTLHYSALRGNEAGLGDGWAWRFSRLVSSSAQAIEHHTLTLANGITVVFDDVQWEALGKGEAVKSHGCRVSSDKKYSVFTVEFADGRQEILSEPAAPGSDDFEPNDTYRQTVLKALRAIRDKSKPQYPTWSDNWTHYIMMVFPPLYAATTRLDYGEAVSAWEEHGNTKDLDKRIEAFERPFVQLLPSRIISQYGEVLDLQWKREQGQFLLMSIHSGKTELFSATYKNLREKTAGQVSMQLWPGTSEAFQVELKLEHFLLRTLQREQKAKVLQQVECAYDDDPTLDRVLCRLTELDGSVECVQYIKEHASVAGSPRLPRVVLHALLPSAGQQNHIARYNYTGSFQNTNSQLFFAEVYTGVHASIRHDLHAFGLDKDGNRARLLHGSGSAQGHWFQVDLVKDQVAFSMELVGSDMELIGRDKTQAELKKEQADLDKAVDSTSVRYTGWGDKLAKVFERITVTPKPKDEGEGEDGEMVIKSEAMDIPHQDALVRALWAYSPNLRKHLAQAIDRIVSLVPEAQRDQLGMAVEATTLTSDSDDKPLRIVTEGSQSIHYLYYTEATPNQTAFTSPDELIKLPNLGCPFIPDYAQPPLMAEYRCDQFGNPQDLKLYGYRKVTRGKRAYLELADVVVVQGVKGTLVKNTLNQHTGWAQTGEEVLWQQISTATTVPSSKKTATNESKGARVVDYSKTDHPPRRQRSQHEHQAGIRCQPQ
ncbi:hypothetical protein [Pseudomonas shirazensis]|uniref:hypothetical protein n=1 Tax=Pseudomonas shirazensis TaxID=2745494 RepID=UPI003D2855A9